MSDGKQLITSNGENALEIIKEIEDAYMDIPFENSAFQTEHFVIGAQITPERAYRTIGLTLHKKLLVVQEYVYNSRIEEIKEMKLRSEIEAMDKDDPEREIKEIELAKRNMHKPFQKKLFNDAIHELNILYHHFKALPKYTREEFEAGEKRYYLESLNRQRLELTGPKEALINMLDDSKNIKQYEDAFKLIANDYTSEQLKELGNSLSSILPIKDKERIEK